MKAVRTLAACALALVCTAGPASASSPEAWAKFRRNVEEACLAAGAHLFDGAPAADVDPFGSKSYGVALLQGKARGADTEIRAICVFDKRTEAVEVGGALPER